MDQHLTNSSVIGRLLEELSWEGATVRAYRDGGRGRENVLTAEVFLPLSYLPRSAFLGEILRSAHGSEPARARAVAEIEQADLTLLPDETQLPPHGLAVQPDATIVSPSCHVLVEAKRIRRSSFQPEQLAREYLAVLHDAGEKTPLLLLVLGAPPPVRVKGRQGLLGLTEAVELNLASVRARTDGVSTSLADLIERVNEVLAWVTWAEVREIVLRQGSLFAGGDSSMAGTVQRLCHSVKQAIDWHS